MADVLPLPPPADRPPRAVDPKPIPLAADAKQLAALLGISVRSIRTLDAGGKLPRPVKLGSRTVWVLSEINAWLAAGAPDRATWAAIKAAKPKA